MQIVSVTPAAKDHIAVLMGQAPVDAQGLKVSIKQGGCSGYEYDISYAADGDKFGEVVDLGEHKLFIDPGAIMFLLGATIDYEVERFSAGFRFINPNEKARCGCGESITF